MNLESTDPSVPTNVVYRAYKNLVDRYGNKSFTGQEATPIMKVTYPWITYGVLQDMNLITRIDGPGDMVMYKCNKIDISEEEMFILLL